MARVITEESELLAMLKQLERSSLGGDEGDLQAEREIANEYYMAEAVGRLAPPAEEDLTAVVSHDLQEAVEWTVPELLKTFLGGVPVEFTPIGPEDVQSARQESKIVNHIVTSKNNGYVIYDTWFRDAFIQRNGYVYAEWEPRINRRVERYERVVPEQLVQLEAEIRLAREEMVVIASEQHEDGTVTVEIEVTGEASQVTIHNVAPENMRVSADAGHCLEDASYVADITYPTRTDLIEMGMDRDMVDALPAYRNHPGQDQTHRHARDTVGDESHTIQLDKSMDKIKVVRAFPKVDWNRDGMAERRKILYAENRVLTNEEWPLVPYAHITPIMRPHRHVGLGYFDLIGDIQEIQTTLWRQLLDNVFVANHNAMGVNDNAVIDYDDFLISRPNSVFRVKGRPQEHILPISRDVVSHRLLPIMEWVDTRKEARTGVGRTSQGLDADVLEKTTARAFDRGLTASSVLKEGIARNFAETGVKDLMRIVHRLMIEHQDYVQDVMLGHGGTPEQMLLLEKLVRPEERFALLRQMGWVPVNPRQWRHRRDMTAKVGLGVKTDKEEAQSLQAVGAMQQAVAGSGARAMKDENAYNLAEDMVRALGFTNRENRYFTAPQDMPPPQPQENPLVTVEKIKARSRQLSEQFKARLQMGMQDKELSADQQELLANITLELAKLEAERGLDLMKMGLDRETRAAENLLRSVSSGNTGQTAAGPAQGANGAGGAPTA